MFWDFLGRLATVWNVLGCFGLFWDILGCFGLFLSFRADQADPADPADQAIWAVRAGWAVSERQYLNRMAAKNYESLNY